MLDQVGTLVLKEARPFRNVVLSESFESLSATFWSALAGRNYEKTKAATFCLIWLDRRKGPHKSQGREQGKTMHKSPQSDQN